MAHRATLEWMEVVKYLAGYAMFRWSHPLLPLHLIPDPPVMSASSLALTCL